MTIDPEQRTRERIRIEPASEPVIVSFHGAIIASTDKALVLHETGYEPVYYVPRDRVEMGFLRDSERHTTCQFKGEARYWSITAEAQAEDDAVWAYETPHAGVREIAGHVAFDPKKVTIAVG
ncbi:DUF427 domain-containing protein [Aurantimonas sp. A2-1-M11]|uniref:DUF427 domain-containing protein n=1 Tax=Aurantimonas sp. A2-1-M11 TaxID=3113712 RepID=UPI002F94CF00